MLLLLLISGGMASVVPGSNSGIQLECTNDFEELMTCYFDAENCTKHRVSLRGSDGHKRSEARRCSSERCCCSFLIKPIYGEQHQVSVWSEREELLQTKNISIMKSVKPRAPRDVSVTESNGIFQVLWINSGSESLLRSLKPQVHYRDGDDQWESTSCLPSTINEHFVCEIRGQDLKPSTQYWVRVRSVSSWSGFYSDWSREVRFSTSASADVQLTVAVIGLSLGAVFIIAATYWCYLQIRSRWWDSVGNCKNSNLFNLTAQEHKLLNPERTVILTLCAEPMTQISRWSPYSEKGGDGLPSPSSCSSTCSSGPSDSYSNEPVDILARFQDAVSKDLFSLNFKPQNGVLDVSRDSSYGVATQEFNPGPVHVENRTHSIHPPNSWGPLCEAPPHHVTGTSCEIPFIHHEVRLLPSLLEGGEGVTTSGPSHAQSQQPLCHHLFTLPHSDLLPPAEEGYKAFQTMLDGSSVPLVTAAQVKSPTMSADHVQTQNSVQRPFLSLVHSTKSPSVVMPEKVFQIPWKHAARHGWSLDRDATLFQSWAVHTGRYRPGKDKPDPKTWKANFRCALNSLPDVGELRELSRKRGSDACRVYKMFPRYERHRPRSRRQRGHPASDEICSRAESWTPAFHGSAVTGAEMWLGGDHTLGFWDQLEHERDHVFKTADYLNEAELWGQTRGRSRASATWEHWDCDFTSLPCSETFHPNHVLDHAECSASM